MDNVNTTLPEETGKTPPAEALPEAPASASMKVKSPNGAEYIFTMRSDKASTLLFKMTAMEKHLMDKGYTFISQSNGFNKQPAEKKPCPIHGVQMTEKTDKRDGVTKYFSHSQGAYPNFGEWCNGSGYPSDKSNHVPTRDIADF